MKIVVYTSCAMNYIPKARVLAKTLKQYNTGAKIVLCLNDMVHEGEAGYLEGFDRVLSPSDLSYGESWVFKHNVMELCTAVKGRALKTILKDNADADLVMYLDPDVCVYGDLSPVAHYMGSSSIGLTPHILAPESTDIGVKLTEISVIAHGVYNLGHLCVRPGENAMVFASWWADRLDEYCYDDKNRGLFTDQRWVDLAPSIFDFVSILKQPNLNVASWNISNRKIEKSGSGGYKIQNHPLLTYHFSGTGPTGTHKRVREIFAPDNPVTAEIEHNYEAAIGAEGQQALEHRPFAYDFYDNGQRVTLMHRKMYRDHGDLINAFPNPFSTAQKKNFYGWMGSNRPDLMGYVTVRPEQFSRAFGELFDEAYYLAQYPDAQQELQAGVCTSAMEHYLRKGSAMLYNPNRFFDTLEYIAKVSQLGCPISAPAGSMEATWLGHYLTTGIQNNAEPLVFFDSKWYVEQYEDIRMAMLGLQISAPLVHYITQGAREGRQPGPFFNPLAYLAANREAAKLIEENTVGSAIEAFMILRRQV